MQATDLLHPFAIPALPLLAGLVARFVPSVAHRIVIPAAAFAIFAASSLALCADSDFGFVKLDTLAVTMALLVASIGTLVLRFAVRYLEGEQKRPQFLSWMSLTLGSVLTLVISNHVLFMLGAWMAASLSLHRLLLHHPERPGAVFAARKKFTFSRLAEVALFAAGLLLYQGHGSWEIDDIASSIASGNQSGLPAAAFLLALVAMLKSAQFPFHSWLPDTMDTPTPVSAFMHAGIINGGGFLVLRFAPVFSSAPEALWLLAVVGTFTAVFGAVVMLTQPGVKRALAFSTIAQMGFMMIQCGLGAWGLALLHLVTHSLYKAHAFLRAGSTIGAIPRAAEPLNTQALTLGALAGASLVAATTTGLHLVFPQAEATPFAFLAILALAVAYGIARVWSVYRGSLGRAVACAFGITLIALGLHVVSGSLLHDAPSPEIPLWLAAFVTIAFVGLFLFQALLWRASRRSLGRKLYVHALNGFYIHTFINRILNGLWPTKPLS